MRAERYPTQESAELEILGKQTSVVAKIHNLSKTGACVDWAPASFQLIKGDLIRMKIKLPSLKKAHQMNAEVVWSDGQRSGLHFIKIEEIIEKMTVR